MVQLESSAPRGEALQEVLSRIIRRLMKLLVRRGILIEEQGELYMADPGEDRDEAGLRRLQAGSAVYRIAFGERAGQKVLTIQGAPPADGRIRKQALCANLDGFRLHAAVRCASRERKKLERLCRCITRPALANDRVRSNDAGQVVLKLKTPWRDGTMHQVMPPLEFMQRLAALVPRRRLHLIRFHGVSAPNAKLRGKVVPKLEQESAKEAPADLGEAQRLRPANIGGAKLLKRVFNIDLEHCPNCGGELRIIAAIVQRSSIKKIFSHLGLEARALLPLIKSGKIE